MLWHMLWLHWCRDHGSNDTLDIGEQYRENNTVNNQNNTDSHKNNSYNRTHRSPNRTDHTAATTTNHRDNYTGSGVGRGTGWRLRRCVVENSSNDIVLKTIKQHHWAILKSVLRLYKSWWVDNWVSNWYKLRALQPICYSLRIWQNQQNDCAPSEDSDQPGHPPSLIRVFAVHMKKHWVLSYPLSAQRGLWSDWPDAGRTLILLAWS